MRANTKEEMVAQIPDPKVDPSQYHDLVHYWCSEKGQVYMTMSPTFG